MSVRTRVGMVAALGAAASLVVVGALMQAGGSPETPHRDADSGGADTAYVPLEGIAIDEDPAEIFPLPATDAEGQPIVDEPEPVAPPASQPWSAPYWMPPDSSPPAAQHPGSPPSASGDGGYSAPKPNSGRTPPRDPDPGPPPAASAPDEPGTAEEPAVPAPRDRVVPEPADPGEPASEVESETDSESVSEPEPDPDPAPEPAPDIPATGGAPDAPTGPLPDLPIPPEAEVGAVDGGAAPGGPVEHLPTDVIEGIVPPPAELLPPPPDPVTPIPTVTPSPTPTSPV